MTKATLILHQDDGDDVTAEFDITTREQAVVIEIRPDGVEISREFGVPEQKET